MPRLLAFLGTHATHPPCPPSCTWELRGPAHNAYVTLIPTLLCAAACLSPICHAHCCAISLTTRDPAVHTNDALLAPGSVSPPAPVRLRVPSPSVWISTFLPPRHSVPVTSVSTNFQTRTCHFRICTCGQSSSSTHTQSCGASPSSLNPQPIAVAGPQWCLLHLLLVRYVCPA